MSITQAERARLAELFPSLTSDDMERLLKMAATVTYPAKTYLFDQGDYADKFYILLGGQVAVYLEVGDRFYQVDKMGYGCFGEISLLLGNQQTRTATVMTKKESRVIEIPRHDFLEISKQIPSFGMEVSRLIIRRLVEQDKMAIQKLSPMLQERTSETMVNRRKLMVEPVYGVPSRAPQHRADIFVIMPFAEELKPVYENHIRKVATELHMSIRRGDDFFSKEAIMNEIWSATVASKLVIADCTGKNPNVFYELGIAHTLGKATILITQNEADIPFDIRQFRYIKYTNSAGGLAQLEQDLRRAIKRLMIDSSSG